MKSMPSNRTKEKLLRGEAVFGCIMPYPDPALVELMGVAGIDFVRFEGEHGPATLDQVEHCVRAAELFGVTPTARVPFNLPHEILRFLDRGVVGVTVPNVSTRAQAEAAVRAARHYPFGERGHNAGGRPSRYGAEGLTTAQYYERLNEQTLVIALIESAEGMASAEAIATTPGVDAIDIGPSDLAQSLGLPPAGELERAVDRIVEIAVAAGKPVGVGNAFGFANGRRMRDLYAKGCRYFLGNTDSLFRHGAAAALDLMRETAAG